MQLVPRMPNATTEAAAVSAAAEVEAAAAADAMDASAVSAAEAVADTGDAHRPRGLGALAPSPPPLPRSPDAETLLAAAAAAAATAPSTAPPHQLPPQTPPPMPQPSGALPSSPVRVPSSLRPGRAQRFSTVTFADPADAHTPAESLKESLSDLQYLVRARATRPCGAPSRGAELSGIARASQRRKGCSVCHAILGKMGRYIMTSGALPQR